MADQSKFTKQSSDVFIFQTRGGKNAPKSKEERECRKLLKRCSDERCSFLSDRADLSILTMSRFGHKLQFQLSQKVRKENSMNFVCQNAEAPRRLALPMHSSTLAHVD